MQEKNTSTFGGIKITIGSIVRLSELRQEKRIDADRYRTRYLELEDRLKNIHTIKKLKHIIVKPVRTGHTPRNREIYEDDSRVHFIKTDTLRDGLIDFGNSDFLPSRVLSENSYLKPYEIIVTIIGAHFDIIGRSSIFLPHYPKSCVNQNIAVIAPDVMKVNPFYLMVFLNCRFGRDQLWMLSRQTEQVNLNCREVEELLVPAISTDVQGEIETLTKNSLELIEESRVLYSQGEKLLLRELQLEDFKLKYQVSYANTLCEALAAHRMDAEYFQPLYEELMRRLKDRVQVKSLARLILGLCKGVEVGSEHYREEGEPFIRVSNLSVNGFVGRDQEYISEELYQELCDDYEPRLGDFLLTKDATPGIAYVVKEPTAGIISSGILKAKVDEKGINKEYLSLCVNSIIGRLQAERDSGGSVIAHWKTDRIKKLQIPILPNAIQQKLGSLVQQSHDLTVRAKESLEKAKRKVEEAIGRDLK